MDFDNEQFIEKAITATSSYKYTYKNCAYLRFCFMVYYFEIDICKLHEKQIPHSYAKQEYNFEFGLSLTQKEFFHDIPRSNVSKNLHALQPYIEIFLNELKIKEFYGLYPEVMKYMRDILLQELDAYTIISNYENFIAYFYKMIEYLNENYNRNYKEDNYLDSTYSSNLELYIEDLTNPYTESLWADILFYPAYVNLNEKTILDTVSEDYKYWNFIFENWESFFLLNEEINIWTSFKNKVIKANNKDKDNSNADTRCIYTKNKDINKCISSLYNECNYAKTNLLLDNAEKYACFLSVSFKFPHRNLEQIKKIAQNKIDTIREKSCFLFCKNNKDILSQLNKDNIRLLFRIACLGNNTSHEVPSIDLESFVNHITKVQIS